MDDKRRLPSENKSISEFYATLKRKYEKLQLKLILVTFPHTILTSSMIYITKRIEYLKISFRGAPIVRIIRNSTYVKCVKPHDEWYPKGRHPI